MKSERWWISRSALVGAALAALAMIWGLIADAQVLIYDGIVSLLDVAMSGLALFAAGTAASPPDPRYPFGREAITPLVIGAQGAALAGSSVYAMLSATLTILHGGNTPDAAAGIAFAAFNALAVLATSWWLLRARPATDLVRAEAAAWRAAIPRTVGILAGFTVLLLLDGTDWHQAMPYIDPAMVIAACALTLPTAVRLIRISLAELLERAPDEAVQAPVRDAVTSVARRTGLTDVDLRVTKLGAKLYVEVNATAPAGGISLAQIDAARRELRAALTRPERRLWLNVEVHTRADYLLP
ncbi:cation diffusion facilitator family transporter [Luedemannella flava]|uniref:Cation diffusion facilitator family transporter n=1 Tax=Luedemannella flava TaxID=349316 RepID=A0ABN2LNN8_9ACTN